MARKFDRDEPGDLGSLSASRRSSPRRDGRPGCRGGRRCGDLSLGTGSLSAASRGLAFACDRSRRCATAARKCELSQSILVQCGCIPTAVLASAHRSAGPSVCRPAVARGRAKPARRYNPCKTLQPKRLNSRRGEFGAGPRPTLGDEMVPILHRESRACPPCFLLA